MLSSASLLFALKSGCLNSQACGGRQYMWRCRKKSATHPCSVRRLSVLFVVVPHFVKVIFVQLSNKTGKIAVLEMLWQYVFREFFILQNDEAVSLVSPSHNTLIGRILQHPAQRLAVAFRRCRGIISPGMGG